MGKEYSLTVKEVAQYLHCSKSYIQRLIREERLKAELQNTPVKYYLINLESVERYKNSPKNKGGRPRKNIK